MYLIIVMKWKVSSEDKLNKKLIRTIIYVRRYLASFFFFLLRHRNCCTNIVSCDISSIDTKGLLLDIVSFVAVRLKKI